MDSTNLASAGTFEGVTIPKSKARPELWFVRGLWLATALAGIAMVMSGGLMLWLQNESSPPESVVAAHSYMLADSGRLYYDLNQYPYTVSAYMPIFYSLEAGLIKLGLSAFPAGRILSFAALFGLIILAGRIVRLYTGNQTYEWIAKILVAICPLTLYWGSVGQVDVLAIFFTVAAFYQFSRHQVLGEPTLWKAGVLAGLALFTKQTMVAAPAAMVLTLAMSDWKKAARFALSLGIPLVALLLAVNVALDGRFLENTVFANMNPMSGEKLITHLTYLGGVCGGLIVMAVVTARNGLDRAPLTYLILAALVFLGTAPKIGSDTNYQVELSVILAICSAIGLYRMDFLKLYFAGSKSLVTLLILPLAVHVVVGSRVATNMFIGRIVNEQFFRAEIAGLDPLVEKEGGRVLSTDFNAMVRLRHRMDVEPLIYGLLVQAGQVDPEPVRRDLERGDFSTVILHQDVFRGHGATGAELAALPESQIAAIRGHYRLAAHVQGPFLDGVFVYKPTVEVNPR